VGRAHAARPAGALIYTAWVRRWHRALYADELGATLFADVANSDEVRIPLHMLASARRAGGRQAYHRNRNLRSDDRQGVGHALDDLQALWRLMESWRWGDAHPRCSAIDCSMPSRRCASSAIAALRRWRFPHPQSRPPSVNFAARALRLPCMGHIAVR